MCGIYGMIAERGTLRHPELLNAMGASLRHREASPRLIVHCTHGLGQLSQGAAARIEGACDHVGLIA